MQQYATSTTSLDVLEMFLGKLNTGFVNSKSNLRAFHFPTS